VFLDSPVSGVVAEVGDGELGVGLDVVTQEGDAVEAEADDVAPAYAASRNWESERWLVSYSDPTCIRVTHLDALG
jgi:hypothetical protein